MKAKLAAVTRRLEELELKKVHEVQVKLCPNCQSYEHLVEECPTILVEREMFGDQANVVGQFKPNNNTSYSNIAWKLRSPQYTQPGQAPQLALNLEQAIVNPSKLLGDFVGDQKSINAQLS